MIYISSGFVVILRFLFLEIRYKFSEPYWSLMSDGTDIIRKLVSIFCMYIFIFLIF